MEPPGPRAHPPHGRQGGFPELSHTPAAVSTAAQDSPGPRGHGDPPDVGLPALSAPPSQATLHYLCIRTGVVPSPRPLCQPLVVAHPTVV